MERPRFELDSSAWIALAILGIIAGLVGVLYIAPMHFVDAAYLGIAVTFVSWGFAWYALEQWYEFRSAEAKRPPKLRPLTGRAKEIALAPSFEVYKPGPRTPPDAPPGAKSPP